MVLARRRSHDCDGQANASRELKSLKEEWAILGVWRLVIRTSDLSFQGLSQKDGVILVSMP